MTRRTSLRDVAQAANVSAGTVSHYLNHSAKVSPQTQQRIQKAIDDLGYRRNEVARSLRRARTKTLGVLLPNVANPFYTALFDGIEEEAQHRGYTVTLGITHYNNALLEEYISNLYNRRTDGIIIDGYDTYCAADVFHDLDIPFVVVEPPANFTGWSTIKIDNVGAAQQAVEHLINRGHRRIALVVPWCESRFAGYQQALKKHGIPFDPDLVYQFGPFEPDSIAQGERAMQALLARASFTACFVTADMLAIGALKAAKASGLQIPDDLAIIGFDDIPFAALTDPPLTTVAQSQYKMGKMAVQTLLRTFGKDKILEPVHVTVQHQLVVRGST
ncbi:MAG: LacI family transcriptional regulator [Anaerolineae bacterium]|nr:LacI family transcriptional regulator [Anaerolineae bacterium]